MAIEPEAVVVAASCLSLAIQEAYRIGNYGQSGGHDAAASRHHSCQDRGEPLEGSVQDCLGSLSQSSIVQSSRLDVLVEVLKCLKSGLQHGLDQVERAVAASRLHCVHLTQSNKAVS